LIWRGHVFPTPRHPRFDETQRFISQTLCKVPLRIVWKDVLQLAGDGGSNGLEKFRRSPTCDEGANGFVLAAVLLHLVLRRVIVSEQGGFLATLEVSKA
jgi:hypothetical protein